MSDCIGTYNARIGKIADRDEALRVVKSEILPEIGKGLMAYWKTNNERKIAENDRAAERLAHSKVGRR